jgi:hypothetical protein
MRPFASIDSADRPWNIATRACQRWSGSIAAEGASISHFSTHFYTFPHCTEKPEAGQVDDPFLQSGQALTQPDRGLFG